LWPWDDETQEPDDTYRRGLTNEPSRFTEGWDDITKAWDWTKQKATEAWDWTQQSAQLAPEADFTQPGPEDSYQRGVKNEPSPWAQGWDDLTKAWSAPAPETTNPLAGWGVPAAPDWEVEATKAAWDWTKPARDVVAPYVEPAVPYVMGPLQSMAAGTALPLAGMGAALEEASKPGRTMERALNLFRPEEEQVEIPENYVWNRYLDKVARMRAEQGLDPLKTPETARELMTSLQALPGGGGLVRELIQPGDPKNYTPLERSAGDLIEFSGDILLDPSTYTAKGITEIPGLLGEVRRAGTAAERLAAARRVLPGVAESLIGTAWPGVLAQTPGLVQAAPRETDLAAKAFREGRYDEAVEHSVSALLGVAAPVLMAKGTVAETRGIPEAVRLSRAPTEKVAETFLKHVDATEKGTPKQRQRAAERAELARGELVTRGEDVDALIQERLAANKVRAEEEAAVARGETPKWARAPAAPEAVEAARADLPVGPPRRPPPGPPPEGGLAPEVRTIARPPVEEEEGVPRGTVAPIEGLPIAAEGGVREEGPEYGRLPVVKEEARGEVQPGRPPGLREPGGREAVAREGEGLVRGPAPVGEGRVEGKAERPVAEAPGEAPGRGAARVEEEEAPSLIEIAVDVIEDIPLRKKAERAAKERGLALVEGREPPKLPPELEAHAEAIDADAQDVRRESIGGRQRLAKYQKQFADDASQLPDGVYRMSEGPTHAVEAQVHDGKVVGIGEAGGPKGQKFKTRFIVGGRGGGSPVSVAPLKKKMRRLYIKDDVVTTSGELSRRVGEEKAGRGERVEAAIQKRRAERAAGQVTPEVRRVTAARELARAAERSKTAATREVEGRTVSELETAPKGESDAALRGLSAEYIRTRNVKPGPEFAPHDETRAKAIGDAYEAMKHDPTDPAVKASYDALARDVQDQYDFLLEQGYKLEPWTKEGQPYANSKEMTADVQNNKHLFFFTGGDMPADHPLGRKAPNGLTYNDMLRAVHDAFGHAKEGFQFGPRGEEHAWREHNRMFSPEARGALTTETRGQNSWVNFGPHMRTLEGRVPKKGEPGYKPPAERPYAEQKAGLLPAQFLREQQERYGPGVRLGTVGKERVAIIGPDPDDAGRVMVADAKGNITGRLVTEVRDETGKTLAKALAERASAAEARREWLERYGPPAKTREEAEAQARESLDETKPGYRNQDGSKDAGSGVRTLGVGINAELRKKGWVNLRGLVAKTVDQVAEIAQVFRDPRIETFRIVATKGGKIAGDLAWTSRLPNQALAIEPGSKAAANLHEMTAWLNRVGADGYYLVHNHPGGVPRPSQEDIDLTNRLVATFQGQGGRGMERIQTKAQYQGHVIIDSGKYGVIDTGMKSGMRDIPDWDGKDPLLTSSMAHGLIGQKVKGPDDVAGLGRTLHDPNMVTLIYRGGDGTVRAIQQMPANLFANAKEARNYIRGRQREFGAADTFAYFGNAKLQPASRRVFATGVLRDAIFEKPHRRGGVAEPYVSLHEAGAYRGGEPIPERYRVGEDEVAYGRALEDAVNEAKYERAMARLPKRSLAFEHPLKPSRVEGKPTIESVWEKVTKATRKFFSRAPGPDASDAQKLRYFLKVGEREMLHQLSELDSGKDWYAADIRDLEDVMGRAMPELKDKSNLTMFKAVTALSSFGNDPNMNLDVATRIWDEFQRTGKFNEKQVSEKNWPGRAKAYKSGLTHLQHLVDTKGMEGAAKWLEAKHPVKELNALKLASGGRGSPVAGKMTDIKPGFFILGPKGGPFALNLSGNTDYVTMDLWNARTWNRRMGLERSDAPRPRERALMEQAWTELGKKFAINRAQAQAVDWYYERRMWDKSGLRERGGSFATGARRAIESREARARAAGQEPGERPLPTPMIPPPKQLTPKEARLAIEAEPAGLLKDLGRERSMRHLPAETQREISRTVLDHAIDRVARMVGLDIVDRTHGTGAYKAEANPNLIAVVKGTVEQALDAAHLLGYSLKQEAIGLFKGNPKGDHQDIDIRLDGFDVTDQAQFAKLWDEVKNDIVFKELGIEGASVITVRGTPVIRTILPIDIMLTSKEGRLVGEALALAGERITDGVVSGHVKFGRSDVNWIANDWKASPEGEGYRERLTERGYGRASDLHDELRKLYTSEIEAAETRGAEGRAAEAKPAEGVVREPEAPYGAKARAEKNERIESLKDAREDTQAGFITPAGKRKALSPWSSHGQVLGSYAKLRQANEDGYVRWSTTGGIYGQERSLNLDIGAPLSSKVERTIRELAEAHDGRFFIDVKDTREKTARQNDFSYEAGTKAVKILGDIRRFYAGEEMPRGVREEAAPYGAPSDVSPLGFYSNLQRAAAKLPQVLRGEQAVQYFAKQKRKVTRDEMRWTGLLEYLKERGRERVTPKEIQDYVRAQEIRVDEVVRGERPATSYHESMGDLSREMFGRGVVGLDPSQREQLRAAWDAEAKAAAAPRPKFAQYTLPGGENYREVVLTLPTDLNKTPQELAQREYRKDWYDLTPEQMQRIYDMQRKTEFRGGHFEEPNVLAHLRLNDRVDADGKKVLFIEEAQSDWGQRGRREGFAGPMVQPSEEALANLRRARKDVDDVTRELSELEKRTGLRDKDEQGRFTKGYDDLSVPQQREFDRLVREQAILQRELAAAEEDAKPKPAKGPPAAPFVTKTEDWTDLAMKRVLRMAAEGGYERVAWTTGKQQAERYDLSKRLSRVSLTDTPEGERLLVAYDHDGNKVLDKYITSSEDLVDTIGKEAADKLLAVPGNELIGQGQRPMTLRELRGLDLKVGGEGMRGFYDEIVPQRMNKLGRQWGTKTGKTRFEQLKPAEVEGGWGLQKPNGDYLLDSRYQFVTYPTREAATEALKSGRYAPIAAHSIDISPQMRESVTREGFAIMEEKPEYGAKPLYGAEQPAGRRATGRPPEVEREVTQLEKAAKDIGKKPPDLDRDTVQHWDDLDPKIKDALRRNTDEDFINRAGKRQLEPHEVQALKARLQSRKEVADRNATILKLAHQKGTPESVAAANSAYMKSMLEYIALERANVNDGTAAARALAARARVMAAGAIHDKLLPDILKQLPDISDREAGDLYHAIRTDPEGAARLLQTMLKPGKKAKFIEWYKAGLLHLGSDVANFMGNSMEHGTRIAETVLSGGVERGLELIGAIPKEGTRKGLSDAHAEVRGSLSVVWPALKNYVDEALLPWGHEKISEERKLDIAQTGAIGGVLGRIVRWPFRRLGAGDRFFKAIGGEGELYKLALRKARKEAGPGATNAQIKERFEQIIQEAHDTNNTSHSDLLKAVEKSKELRTFQNATALGQVANTVARHFPLAGNLVLPFRTTPSAVAAAAIARTPLGLLTEAIPTLRRFQKGLGGVTRDEVIDAFSKPVMGTMIMTAAAALAMQDEDEMLSMTGSGPVDPKLNAALKDTGWQPYSFRVKTSNGTFYVPYHRFEPISSLLGMSVDMIEAKDERTARDIAAKITGSLMQNLTNKTYLTGLADATNFITDPMRSASTYLSSLAANVLVPNQMAKIAQAFDPYVRDTTPETAGIAGTPERAVKKTMAKIPGVSRYLPERKGITGEAIERQTMFPGAGIVSPVQVTREKPERDLERLMVKVGYAPGTPSRELTVSGVGKLRLQDDAYEVIRQADAQAAERIRNIMAKPNFQALPDSEEEGGKQSKEYVIRDIYRDMRSAARKRALSMRSSQDALYHARKEKREQQAAAP
jgi:hypothetical protein